MFVDLYMQRPKSLQSLDFAKTVRKRKLSFDNIK